MAIRENALLEALGIDPDTVIRDTTHIEFETGCATVQWHGIKVVSVETLTAALANAAIPERGDA